MRHDITKLPKWAQRLIADRDLDVEAARRELETIRAASAVLAERAWFTLPGPTMADREEYRTLWLLDRDRPLSLCQIGRGDVLLVGRSLKR